MQDTAKKLLMALALAFLLGAPTAARADCPEGPCIASGSFTGAIGSLCGTVTAAIEEAQGYISAYISEAYENFQEEITLKIGPDTNGGDNVTDHITDWIDQFWLKSMEPGMKEMTDQLTALTPDQERQLASIRDAANANRDVSALAQSEIDSQREQRPSESTCQTATVAGGMTTAHTIRQAYGSAAPSERAARSSNATKDAYGNPISAAAGPAADMKDRWDDYKSRYCDKDDNNGHAGCTTSGTYAGQDVDVAGTVFGRETIDVTDANTKQTVDDLLTNVAEPFVRQPIPPNAVNSQDGQRAQLAGQAYTAKRQTVYDSLYYIVARRVPGSSKLKDFVGAMREEAGIPASLISDKPSENEIMQAMMSERFRTGKYASSQIDEPENNQREMITQTAFQLMQMSDQLDLMDRWSMMLAAQVGDEVRRDKKSGTAAMGATTR